MTDLEQIDEWIAILSERSLTEKELSEFRKLLRNSPAAMDRYLDHCDVETWLTAAGDSISGGRISPESIASESPKALLSKPNRKGILFGVAAAILGLAVIGKLVVSPEPSDEKIEVVVPPQPSKEKVELAVVEPRESDPSKVINATGSVQHPGLTDNPVPVTSGRPIKFNRDIRPILSETCFHCHGPDEHGRRADLRLDSFAGATADLDGTVAIVPGDLQKSEAWWRIISEDDDELMPPPESHLVLTKDQKNLLKRWIEEGAEYEGHWAYDTPVRPVVPEFETGQNEIDAFILARLKEEGIQPSPEADPRTLIRRLTFDLTGLPPTAGDVRAFVADYAKHGEDAWQDAIGRLLASPHFGERMAVPWMDQSRYADTNGFSIDGGRHMWLWRDWVIQAYNDNLPFDQFVKQQLAGDLMPNATEAQRVATGFNRNHMITHEGGTIPEENLTNYAVDRVKTTSEVFLGLTMACAQCHDHKFDPIPQKDYYQFFAFFNELSDKGNDGNAGINAGPKINAHSVIPGDELKELRAELSRLKNELATTDAGFAEWLAAQQQLETGRGENFALHAVEMLDISAPNRPGPYELRDDGSVFLAKPSAGMSAFSHALRLPVGKPISGIRVSFFPSGEEPQRLTPHDDGVPKVTTVLVSAGEQPAKQVDIHRQLTLARVTASSHVEGSGPEGIIDERNLHWWQPGDADNEAHLSITFDQPVDPEQSPYLSVMLFYGVRGSLPNHWKIEAFSGNDPDSTLAVPVAAAIGNSESQWTAPERALVLAKFRSDAESLQPMRIRIANLEERLSVLTEPHSTMVMDVAPKPRQTHVLNRGQYDAPMELVSSNTPQVLPPLSASGNATRLDLAEWLVRPEHPLTARVAVNRLWAVFFGTGIVATSADFGSQGEWPSHPQLIDWLATDFVASGWDQKELIRKLVSSATYRQDSSASSEQREFDPNNRLLGRGPRFRLPAEFIRDQTLAKSGLLVPRIGGPSVEPYQPAGLWKEVSHFGSSPATKQVFVQDHGEKLYRRSLYTIVKRTSPHPAMSAFDAPNREMCIMQRGVTNTPLQSLVTLNDPQFAEAARVFAERLLRDTPDADDRERLKIAFEKITSRSAKAAELNALSSFLSDEVQRYADDPQAAAQLVAAGESPLAEGLDVSRHAAWTQIGSLLFNLSETLTRL